MTARFEPGQNLALKVPPHEFEKTVAFYRDVVSLEQLPDMEDAATGSVRFDFGGKVLWIDSVDALSQGELWLELATDDVASAADHLARHQITRRDEIEPLPPDVPGFWISGPGNIIHLVTKPA